MNVKKEKIHSIIHRHKGLKKNLIAILLDIQAEIRVSSSGGPSYRGGRTGHAADRYLRRGDVLPRLQPHAAGQTHLSGVHGNGLPCPRRAEDPGGIRAPARRQIRGHDKGRLFTLETVACLGCCAIGPVVVVDGEYYGHTTIRKVNTILKKYQRGNKPEATTQAAKHA